MNYDTVLRIILYLLFYTTSSNDHWFTAWNTTYICYNIVVLVKELLRTLYTVCTLVCTFIKCMQARLPLLPDSGKFHFFAQKKWKKYFFLQRNLIVVLLSNFHWSGEIFVLVILQSFPWILQNSKLFCQIFRETQKINKIILNFTKFEENFMKHKIKNFAKVRKPPYVVVEWGGWGWAGYIPGAPSALTKIVHY